MVITIAGKVTDTVLEKLVALGFSKQSTGKYNYFRGPSTNEAIRGVTPLGVINDCHTPQGCASMDGILALAIMNRVVNAYFTIMSAHSVDSNPFDQDSEEDDTTIKVTPATPFAITESLEGIPDFGTFLPYFDGLCLPDRAYPVTSFIRMFSRLLGKNAAEISNASSVLMSGWVSLHNTPAGRAMSHIIFCIEQSLEGQFAVKPVLLNSEYTGCVFVGRNVGFQNGPKFVIPINKVKLAEEIQSFMSHESTLVEIAGILTAIKRDSNGMKIDVPAAQIQSPRHLHELLRDRSIDGPTASKLRTLTLKLKFRDTLYDPLNPSYIALAVKAITKKEFLPVTAPFAYRTDALFTKDPILSTLAAFGIRAPSLIGQGNKVVLRITPKMYETVKGGNLVGIPIFFKPLQEAFEDWVRVLADGVVRFSEKGKDKMGRMKVAGVALSIPFETGDAKSILADIVRGTPKVADKRKQREDEDTNDAQVGDAERIKRRRSKGYGLMNFAPLEGIPSGSGIEEVADDDPFALMEE